MSVREFARLDGCNEKLVRTAIKAGKLPVLDGGKVDPALAGSGWRKLNRAADNGADPSALFSDEDFVAAVLSGQFRIAASAERVKENALAAKHLLAARRAAGDVVDIEVAEAVLFKQGRTVRDAWMNWPSRVGPLIAAELGIAADPVVEALSRHVQQQLDDLGDPDPDFAGDES